VPELLHPGDRVLLEHRLDREALHLHDLALARRALGTIREPAQDLLLLIGAAAESRLLLVADRLALDLVDDVIERLLVARSRGSAAEQMPVDAQRDLGEVRVGDAPAMLAPELDGRVGPVVGQALDALELSLGIIADAIRDLGVLALDDRPHGHPQGLRAPAIGQRPTAVEYTPAARRGPRVGAIGRSTLAGDRDRRIPRARPRPRGRRRRQPASTRRHDVVDEQDPSTADRPRVVRAGPDLNAPRTLAARWSRPSSNWAVVALDVSSARITGSSR
jgi:hypothetical protein